jgi:cyclophilin family peptidyl-prolyl cis-trans isomerase
MNKGTHPIMQNSTRLLSIVFFVCSLFSGIAAIAADDAMPRIKLETSEGDIVLELDRSKAPASVDNFIQYVNDGFYDGTIFHRVIENFMIQGGGFTQDLEKKTTRSPVKNEANNGLKNDRGTIAMARTNDPHSATAQFFINVVDNDFLNHKDQSLRGWGYAVFGRVVEGMDVVDTIRNTATGPRGPFRSDVPKTPMVIKHATVLK